jgi:hypothetical protein
MNKILTVLDDVQPGQLADVGYKQQINDHIDRPKNQFSHMSDDELNSAKTVVKRLMTRDKNERDKLIVDAKDINEGNEKYTKALELDNKIAALQEQLDTVDTELSEREVFAKL